MKFINEIEGFFSSKVSVIKGIYKLIILEAKVAEESIYPLFLCFIFLFPLISMMWLSFLLIVGFTIVTLLNNILVMIVALVIIQVGLFLFIKHKVKNYLQDMSFVRTRSCLNNVPLRESNEEKEASTFN